MKVISGFLSLKALFGRVFFVSVIQIAVLDIVYSQSESDSVAEMVGVGTVLHRVS